MLAAMILPPGPIGMVGGGQLGRMTVLAGRRLGYRFAVYEPPGGGGAVAACPAGQVADREVRAAYGDTEALAAFARTCKVVTYEFENVPAAALEAIARHAPVFPAPGINHIAQHRRREKEWLRKNGFPTAPFAIVRNAAELQEAAADIGLPAILKTAAFGYDGKGQLRLDSTSDLATSWDAFAGAHAREADFAGVLEGFVDFSAEYSVTVARAADGTEVAFPVAENVHRNGILDLTVAPARIAPGLADAAVELGTNLARSLGLVGVLTVELFLTRDGRWLVNEMAPRPHNSAHHTIESCTLSQFDLHVRAVAGLPLMAPRLRAPAAMVNLLGDAWTPPGATTPEAEPWFVPALLAEDGVFLHLYDKGEPRAGRKMGHFTVLADSAEAARTRALALREQVFGPRR